MPKNILTKEQMSKGGRNSKRLPLDVQWREKLTNAIGDSDRTALDAIYAILLQAAKDGNIKAIEVLLDRAFGKAVQININSNEEQAKNPVLEQITAMRKAIEDKHRVIEVKQND